MSRVCMFVYNNCAQDPRVLKEARSLTRAGHTVQIVAVLDKLTVPEEEREGFTIVRIARDPPHYKLLRLSRRIRRLIRLRWARVKRRSRSWSRSISRRLTPARRPLTRLISRGHTTATARIEALAAEQSARISEQAERAEARREAEHAARLRAATAKAEAAAALAAATEDPAPATNEPEQGSGIVRIYRALRWRLLRRSELARRVYYRRRTRRKRRRIQHARREATHATAALESLQSPSTRVETPRAQTPRAAAPLPLWVRIVLAPFALLALIARNFVEALELIPEGFRWLERRVSHISYRTVMFFHRPLMHIDYYRRAYKLVSEQPFDVYHAHDLNTLPVAAKLARKKQRPLVYDAHELYSEISTLSRTERRVWRIVEPRLIRRAASVITVCESIAGELSDRYQIPPPTILLNCPQRAAAAATEDQYRLRSALSLDDDDRAIVLYQGGFAPNRGLEELVAAARYFDGGVLVLMGKGKIEDELRELISRQRLEEQVLLHPAVPQDEVIAYASGAEIGVIPYKGVGLNNYYTTPNKLFDYMAAGVAIAGSRFPEIVRFVEGLGIGVTFDPESPRDIAYSINYVLDDRSILDEMRAKARAASARFVWEEEQQKLLEIYGSRAASSALAEVA